MKRHARRLGLFGGTFDPIHVGHLIIAESAAEALRLDRVLLIPAASNPLKRGKSAPAGDRWSMVRAAIRGNPRLEACDLEIRRDGPSFMIDTVHRLEGLTFAKLFLIVGSDAVREIRRWRRARELVRRVTLAVVGRPGTERTAPPAFVPNWVRVPAPAMEISATEIRARVRRGRSIRYLVPEAVAAIIRKKQLYRGT
ncbi:MAG: nicotinate (nicotinamide) nucleotide adenylyltransferase [Planctomycetes bacterium]|nr:nicotinate (nicotinamide) nucleotide adenylyltransferase [Planctomycetota bacterium]